MGLKKIEEMRVDLRKKAAALSKFTDAAKVFTEAHAKIAQAHESLEKTRNSELAKIRNLDALGIKEFEDYKKNLISVYSGWSDRPLPLGPLHSVVTKQQAGVDAAVAEYVAKQAASFPSEIKPGMIFRFEANKELREVVSGPEESKNVNLKGDARLIYTCKTEGGRTCSDSLEFLKKSCKYIKS